MGLSVTDQQSVARIPGIAWHIAHSAVADLGRELLTGHPARPASP